MLHAGYAMLPIRQLSTAGMPIGYALIRSRRMPVIRWSIGSEIQPWLGVWRPSQFLQVTILWSTSANHHLAWLVQQTLELKAIGARSGLLMPFLRS